MKGKGHYPARGRTEGWAKAAWVFWVQGEEIGRAGHWSLTVGLLQCWEDSSAFLGPSK